MLIFIQGGYMKKIFVKSSTLFLAVLLILCPLTAIGAGAASVVQEAPAAASTVPQTPTDIPPEEAELSLEIRADSVSVVVRKTIALTAVVTPASQQDSYPVLWETDNAKIATVNQNGVVKGVSVGRAVIKATLVGTDVSTTFPIFVVRTSNFIHDFFEKEAVLSYKYSYTDDYYYTDDKDCWQAAFGYMNIFDIVAPYVEIEIDYVRVYFNYEDLDWMIQLWKGQYGYLFFGSEMGVYTREPLNGKDIGIFTKFNQPAEENRLNMEMVLYWDEDANGKYVYQFTRPYDKYWWCTAFKAGNLRQSEPADELRMTGLIELKSEEMANIFAEKLVVCGFTESPTAENMPLDSYYKDGKNVSIVWQNISEAESTVIVKSVFWTFVIGNILAIMLVIGFLMSMGLFGLIFLI